MLRRLRLGAGDPNLSASAGSQLWRKLSLLILVAVAVLAQAIWFVDDYSFVEKISVDAFVFSLVALVLGLQHTSNLQAMSDEVGKIAHSLPTRGIGVFPHYMCEVAELVSKTRKSIKILCDTPAHASFSDTSAFTAYWEALRSKVADGEVMVQCAYFDESGRKALHGAQIEEDTENWQDWKRRNQRNCEAFDKLARDQNIDPPCSKQTDDWAIAWADHPDVYVESMMRINAAVLSSLKHGAQVEQLPFERPLRQGPSVYLWLRDDEEAVFVVVPVHGIGVRHLAGFHTRETELIRALKTVFKHRWEGTVEVSLS